MYIGVEVAHPENNAVAKTTIITFRDVSTTTTLSKRPPEPIVIHTDGGCWPNPGPGGWSAVIAAPDTTTVELTGRDGSTTNNRMEMMAAIMALESLPDRSTVVLYSDSKYLVNGITIWVKRWKKKWKKKGGSVKNRDLWERLDAARNRHDVTFLWIKGHDGNEGNERADRLATMARS